jgi:TM2 domain-containing membrane protein YozV
VASPRGTRPPAANLGLLGLTPVMASRSSPIPERTALDRPAERRSVALSYLLWCTVFMGVCGIHRFYNRKPLSGLLWLFTFGLCGIGQILDLLLIPDLVRQANQPLLLQQALEGVEGAAYPTLERQLLQLARRSGNAGFTINDALLELQLPRAVDSSTVFAEIERLLHGHLLDVGNDERGRVIYREP